MGRFPSFVEVELSKIFFDELLYGLGSPFPPLPYEKGIFIGCAFPVSLFKGQELLQVLFQNLVNDDVAGDASLAVVNENPAIRVADLQIPAFQVCSFRNSQASGGEKVYGHPFPNARDLPLLDIKFGLFPCCPSEKLDLVP